MMCVRSGMGLTMRGSFSIIFTTTSAIGRGMAKVALLRYLTHHEQEQSHNRGAARSFRALNTRSFISHNPKNDLWSQRYRLLHGGTDNFHHRT